MIKAKTSQTLDPIPPGEILLEEFLKPLGMNQTELAKAIDVPPGRISQIIQGKRVISADTALRLGRYFGTSPEFWLGLQMEYDLRITHRQLQETLRTRIQPRPQYGT